MISLPSEISSQTVLPSSRLSRLWSTYPITTVSPTFKFPSSGFSTPVSILNNVVLPAPFGPITPTIPPGGSWNDKLSINNFSSNPLVKLSASITTPPRRGPAGIEICARPTSSRSFWLTKSSYAEILALLLACRAFGEAWIHSSSLDKVLWRLASSLASCSSLLCFCSSQEE